MKKFLLVIMVLVLFMGIGCANAEETLDYKNYKWEIITTDFSFSQDILFVRGVFTNNSNEDLDEGLEITIVLYDELGNPVGAGNTYQLSVRSHTSRSDMICVHMKSPEYSTFKMFMNPM